MFEEILIWVLENKRPDGSEAVQHLCTKVSAIFPDRSCQDDCGNVWVDLRAEISKTCFMAHLDTVHEVPGPNPVIWGDGIASTGGRSVLGADDGAGVALLAGLLAAGVPALYLFTQGEETGAQGARYARARGARAFARIDRILAFDRKGRQDICGEQRRGLCASRAFVAELAGRLAMGHRWARGSYTDNCEFRDLVPEIVNISVGYECNHTEGETLDLVYLRSLLGRCVAMDWETLGVHRGSWAPGRPRAAPDLWAGRLGLDASGPGPGGFQPGTGSSSW